MQAVYLEWCDAFSNPGWMTHAELEPLIKDHDFVIREVGWLIEETKEYFIFAGAWSPADRFTNERFANLHKIPTTWIRRRLNLNIPIEKKGK